MSVKSGYIVGSGPTENGGILIKIGGSLYKIFEKEVNRMLGDMDQKVTLRLRDLDYLTNKGGVQKNLEKTMSVPARR